MHQLIHRRRVSQPWTRASTVGAGMVVPGAKHGVPINLAIAVGQDLTLGETGLQLRLTGLRQPLEMACSDPLNLEFEKRRRDPGRPQRGLRLNAIPGNTSQASHAPVMPRP